ncbi:MAG: hypothetical protein WAM28_00565 [Chlamydiales bacterium]
MIALFISKLLNYFKGARSQPAQAERSLPGADEKAAKIARRNQPQPAQAKRRLPKSDVKAAKIARKNQIQPVQAKRKLPKSDVKAAKIARSKFVERSQPQPVQAERSLPRADVQAAGTAQRELTEKEQETVERWQTKFHKKNETQEEQENTNLVKTYVFQNLKGFDTKNEPKTEEFAKYIIRAKDKPVKADKLNELATKYGIKHQENPGIKSITVRPTSVFEGVCHGAVTEWLTTQDHQAFQGGAPIKAVYLHHIYSNYSVNLHDAFLLISGMIIDPNNKSKYMEFLKNDFGQLYVDVYEIFKAIYKNSSVDFNKVETFYDNIHLFTDGNSKMLFRALYEEFSGGNWVRSVSEKGQTEFSFALNNLEIKEAICSASKAEEFLDRLHNLKSGLYYLSIPIFDWNTGEKIGNHALGLRVTDNGKAIFYDPNYRIVWSDKHGIRDMIKRLLLAAYSELGGAPQAERSTEKEKMEALERMGNKFDLYRLERNENMHDLRWFE